MGNEESRRKPPDTISPNTSDNKSSNMCGVRQSTVERTNRIVSYSNTTSNSRYTGYDNGNNSTGNSAIRSNIKTENKHGIQHSTAERTNSSISRSNMASNRRHSGHDNVNSNIASNVSSGNEGSMLRSRSPTCGLKKDRSREDTPTPIRHPVKRNVKNYNTEKSQNCGYNGDNTRKNIGIQHNEQSLLSHRGMVRGERKVEIVIPCRKDDSVNITGNVSGKQNSDSDLLKKDVLTFEEFFKTAVNNNSPSEGNENMKNLQGDGLYSEKKLVTCSSESFQVTESGVTQNLIRSNLQTVGLDNKNSSNKSDSHLHSDVTKHSDSSNDMISVNATSNTSDKTTVTNYFSSDFVKDIDLTCPHEQKLQNSFMKNDLNQSRNLKSSAYSDVQKELLEISFIERHNIDSELITEVPMVLNENGQNKLSKETENVILERLKGINNFADSLLKLSIHSLRSNITCEVRTLTQKLDRILLIFDKERIKRDESDTYLPELSFYPRDENGQLLELCGEVEQQCSLHCNFCKSDISKYTDVETHINGKCNKTTEDESISENNQDDVQNRSVMSDNYRLLMESIDRNRNLGCERKPGRKYYFCVTCDFVCDQQENWKAHVATKDHENSTCLLEDMKMCYCSVCRLYLCGDSATINEHKKLPEHSERVIEYMEHQKVASNESGVNDSVGEVNKVMCSDSHVKERLSKHVFFLKCLFEKKFSCSGVKGHYCKPCNNYAYSYESKGLHCYTKKHKQKFRNDPQSCKQFYCDSCHVYLYGDNEILSEHNEIKYHVLMNTKQVNQKACKPFLKNVMDTTVLSDNEVSDSLVHTDLKQSTKISSQRSEIRTDEKSISVLEILESQSKVETKSQNISKNKKYHTNTEKEFSYSADTGENIQNLLFDNKTNCSNAERGVSHLSKTSENMQNLLFDSGYQMNGYSCRPCAFSVLGRKDWNAHIKSRAHRKRMENSKLKHPKLCCSCKIVFICDDSAFKKHKSSLYHQDQLRLNEKLNSINPQDGSEDENSDNQSESNETEISSCDNLSDIQYSETDDDVEEDTNIKEGNVEDSDSLDEEDNIDDVNSNVSYPFTDDFTSDSYSVSSEQLSRRNRHIQQMKGAEKIKAKGNETKRKRIMGDMPKGLYITGLKQGTTHSQIFHVFKTYGHVQYVDIKYGKKDGALVIYRRGSDVDRIVRDNVSFLVNGHTLKVMDIVKTERLPKYEEDYVLPDSVIKFLKSEEIVRTFMDGLLKTIEECSNVEKQKTALLINDIKSLLPACSVYPFGSRVTGIATSACDLDVYIDIGHKMYNGDTKQEPEQQAGLIDLLGDYFSSQAKDTFSDIQRITNTRVPIIKLTHNLSGLNCDISCMNGLSVENTKLISAYLQNDKRVKWLVVAVKTWAREIKIADITMFTTYALTWLVLFFLMQLKTPLVCSVSDLRAKRNVPSIFIAGWDCTFCSNPDLIPPSRNTQSCVELLHEFFNFYATFPFRKCVLCPLIGKTLSREAFKTVSELPPQMKTYIKKCKNNPHAYLFQINTAMCVQDPFDLSQNIVKRVKGPVMKKFVTLCKESAKLCDRWK